MVRCFSWGSKMGSKWFLALKAWKDICQPKNAGVLGFHRFKDINSALLAKLGWKVVGGNDSLWSRILQAKYLRGKSFFDIGKAKGSSRGWQCILSSRPFILSGACYRLKNGLKINP